MKYPSLILSILLMAVGLHHNVSAATPAASGELFDFKPESAATLKIEHAATVSISDAALKIDYVAGGYPGVDFKASDASWDLSAFGSVEAEVTNKSEGKIGVGMRVDNPGDWQKSPWNSETLWLEAGATGTIRVTFGQSYGKPAFALNPKQVTTVKLFVTEPKAAGALLVKSLKASGSPQPAAAAAPAAAGAAETAAASFAPSVNSPPISGEVIRFDDKLNVSTFRTNQTKVSRITHEGFTAVQIDITGAGGYPNVQIPIPAGGLNLDAFGGVKAELVNTGTSNVRVGFRVDNPGDWKKEPWNTTLENIKPGESKTIEVIFGKNGTAPGYPLNPTNVSAMQLFAAHPKEAATLVLKDIKAFGTASDRVDKNSFSTPEDRNKPVTPPEWLGKKPPVDGDWVQTLDENFDGNALNAAMWTPRFPWDGPQPGQLQRYAPENVIVEGGVAKFKAEKRHGHENNDPSRPTREYTSGLIQSYDKWAQAYGYFEARIKLPKARGLWPAFWMMPDRGAASGLDTWQRRDTGKGGMEIDILEHLCEWGPGRNNVAVHWDGYGAEHKSWGTSNIYFGPTPDGWHNFGVLWEPGKLTWFIDGKKVVEWENPRIASVPGYLKLNIQMGGWATKDVDLASLPDYMEVDYVRAWQLKSRIPAPVSASK